MKKGILALISLLLLAFSLPLQACQPVDASNFDVLSLDVTPNKVNENDKFTVTAIINNSGNSEATYIVPVMDDGVADDRIDVKLAPGKSQELKITLRRGQVGTYQIRIGSKSASVFVEKIIPASFKLSDLKINMETANPGEEVIITAQVTNTGGSKGTFVTELIINGVAEKSDKAAIEPGSSYFPVFKVAKTEPGTYTVSIDDLTGKYTVQKPVETIQFTAPTPAAQKRFTQRPSSCCGGGDTSGCE
ncbi:MAG: hypothetical protein NTZ34_04405 [Chloroflexi bacterium]|nr:hypothetical protein [Chloroflexota bacterium]